jgi:hypothetical protein
VRPLHGSEPGWVARSHFIDQRPVAVEQHTLWTCAGALTRETARRQYRLETRDDSCREVPFHQACNIPEIMSACTKLPRSAPLR